MIEIDHAALSTAKVDPQFLQGGWLTFYLMGPPENHRAMRAELKRIGAVNLEGEEGGFVYAKLPVSLEAAHISASIDVVARLANEHGLDLSIIDLDSSPNVERSKFYTLWTQ